ncbi:MAG: TVP38/TMEM64 family protein [Synergistales bacterium]|nr:TVP38/TMEM64 family protein [Synergistales bacterium]
MSGKDQRERPPSTGKRYFKVFILIVLFLSGIIVLRMTGGISKFQEACKNLECLGKWAPLGFIGIYVLAVVLAVPGSALTALAGVLFGSFWGVIYVSIASTVGATLAFLVSRYLARDFVAEKIRNRESFRRLDDMTEKHGPFIVAIVRLIPVFPFSLVNYGFGLTGISLKTYVFFSWLFMIPGTILYVAGGDALQKVLLEGQIPWKLLVVIAVTGGALYYLGHKYKDHLR